MMFGLLSILTSAPDQTLGYFALPEAHIDGVALILAAAAFVWAYVILKDLRK